MSSSLLTFALTISLGQFPGPAVQTGHSGYGAYGAKQPIGAFHAGDPYYPYDAYEPWVHGHWQEMPAYGGSHYFRPYNYKHVLSQAQVAGGWGMSPTMPYSQEYFRRVREHTSLEQRLSHHRTSAYHAELARLRTQQDAAREAEMAAPPAQTQDAANQPAVIAQGHLDPAGQPVDRASYNRISRVQELNQLVEQQTQQLQQLQQALQDAYDRPAPTDDR